MVQNAHLFAEFQSRGLRLPNRIVVSPMAQYSAHNGYPTDWHFVHLGSRAVAGPGLLIVESTAVTPQGRCSQFDTGIYEDGHTAAFGRIVDFVHEQGTHIGIQLGHGGRKSSMNPPWVGEQILSPEEGGWTDIVAPSPLRYNDNFLLPEPLTEEGIESILAAYARAAQRAVEAGFDLINLHMAHGYLLHEFLSPLSNQRTDRFGGSFENRVRFPLAVVDAIRKVIPDAMPFWVRISATDWVPGGWDVEDSNSLCRLLHAHGADLIDVSSGGMSPLQHIPVGAGYQTELSSRVRREAGVPVGAVGLITNPQQADHIIRTGQADVVLLARELLRNPYWPMFAANELRQPHAWPLQYVRARSEERAIEHPKNRVRNSGKSIPK